MDKEVLLQRYKELGIRLKKNEKTFQIKQLKDCMDMISNSFDPDSDGRHALIQRLNSLNEGFISSQDNEKKIKYEEAMCVVAACIALFQKNIKE